MLLWPCKSWAIKILICTHAGGGGTDPPLTILPERDAVTLDWVEPFRNTGAKDIASPHECDPGYVLYDSRILELGSPSRIPSVWAKQRSVV